MIDQMQSKLNTLTYIVWQSNMQTNIEELFQLCWIWLACPCICAKNLLAEIVLNTCGWARDWDILSTNYQADIQTIHLYNEG